MCVSYSFLHGVFLSKFTSLKKPQKRLHYSSQNTDRIQVANSRPPGTRAKREEGQVYCYLNRKIDGKIALPLFLSSS